MTLKTAVPRCPRRLFAPRAAIVVTLLATGSGAAFAAPPEATSLFPAGGGRGQSIEVTVAGKFDHWPLKTWVHEPGLEIEPGEKKGQLTIRISADAPPGLRWIRFYDDAGASGLLPFAISTVPSIVEAEPNDAPDQAAKVEPLPVEIDGRFAKSGDVDGYRVTLKKGQTLVASLAGHRLGSPMDAVLQVVSPAGFVQQQTDDEVGLDPQLVFHAPEDGDYIVRCFAFPADPNSSIRFAGGESYIYRLTLTTGSFLDHVMPLAASADSGGGVFHPSGWNLPDDVATLAAEPTAFPDRVRIWHPTFAGLLTVPVLPAPAVVEAETNTDDVPQPLTLPTSVSGRIVPDGDRDLYRFTAKKGETWKFRLVAGGLGSSLDPVLRLLDATGKVLSEKDATGKGGRNIEQSFTIPQDGGYIVSVHDLTERSSPRHFYRLEARKPTPDYTLTLASDRVNVVPGKPATIAVTVNREEGFAEPIDISVDGLPDGIELTAVHDELKADASAKPGSKPVQSTANLTLTAKEGVAAYSGPMTIVGSATGKDATHKRTATAALSLEGVTTSQIWLTVEQPMK